MAPELRAADRIADLGAGAGLPSLVLAAALPDAEVFAIESVHKKADFIVRTAQAMGLTNVEVIPLRVEEWAAGEGTIDVVTARALAPLPVLVEYAAPLLREGGHLVAWKGPADREEETAGTQAAELVGLAPVRVDRVQAFRGADRHHLHLYSKVASTPNRYPRRPGMARKRPLAGSGRG
jgi:16S rRNA (guanine527-N7)-methyltransferase